MSKKMLFVLIISLLLVGCSNNEITTEKNEQADVLKDYEYILEGKLLSNEPPHGTSIKLDNPLDLKVNVNGKQNEFSFSSISLSNDVVYNYVDRNQFTYNEPFILLKQDANISVQIKVDLTNFFTSETINAIDVNLPLFIENFELLEVNGEKQLIDKSGQPYPFATTNDSKDITDRSVIIDFICSEYDVENLRSALEENLKIENIDFTGDGIQDAICYVDDVTLGFYDMVFITNEDSDLKILEFEGSDYQKHAHRVSFDDTFIHYIYESGGHGMSGKVRSLFVYDDGKIKDTKGYVYIEGGEAQPPAYVTKTTSTVDFENAENDYTAFNVTLVTTGSAEHTYRSQFKYDPEIKEFSGKTTLVSDAPVDTNILHPKDIYLGQNIGGLQVSSVEWIENDQFTLEMNGEILLDGVIKGFFNDIYSDNEFFFVSNEKFSKHQLDFLDSDIKSYLLEGNELEIIASVTNYNFGAQAESGGYESIEIQSISLVNEEKPWLSDVVVKETFIDPKTIQNGQEIEDLSVFNIIYEEGDSIQLNLKAIYETLDNLGVLTGTKDNGYGETEFYYTSQDEFDKPIQYTFNSNYSNSINSFSGVISDSELELEPEAKQYILDGNSLLVIGNVDYFSHSAKDESGGSSQLSYTVLEIPDIEWHTHQEEKNLLTNEIFTTTNQGDFYVDYSLYSSVIVPMLESKNSDKLEHIEVNFDGGTEFKFTVLGVLENVQINYVAYAGEEGAWENLGTVSNSVVEIKAQAPNDNSAIFVTGQVLKSNGTYEDIKFTLDDMRDLSAYDLYLVEK